MILRVRFSDQGNFETFGAFGVASEARLPWPANKSFETCVQVSEIAGRPNSLHAGPALYSL